LFSMFLSLAFLLPIGQLGQQVIEPPE